MRPGGAIKIACLVAKSIIYCAGKSILEMFQFRSAQKWDRCSPHRANWTKPKCTLVADSVLRLVVQGWEHSWTGSGRMMVRLGRGRNSHLTGQPSGSWKYVETGTSLYVQPRRLTKLVLEEESFFHHPYYHPYHLLLLLHHRLFVFYCVFFGHPF